MLSEKLYKLYSILQKAPNINKVKLEELEEFNTVSEYDLDKYYEVAKTGDNSIKLAYGWLVLAKADKTRLDSAIECIKLSADSSKLWLFI